MPLLAALALATLAVWVYLVAFHGFFWRSGPQLPIAAPSGQAPVAVVIPARDEAASIHAALASLLAQNYSGPLSIILVDDNSTDATAQIAAQLAASAPGRLTILAGQPLPPGWTGKLWAISQGLDHPIARAAGYILLTDADIVHAPHHVSSLVAHAEQTRTTLVSEMVRLHCRTLPECALIPAFVFFFQMLYPFTRAAAPARRLAAAAGGTILVARAALDQIGGVSSIRSRLIDDCALAHAVKSNGARIWLGHADDTVSTRVYPAWADIWNMIARTAYAQLGFSPLALLGCVLGMALVYCAPPALACGTHGLPRLAAAVAWLLMALSFQPTLRRYRCSPLWGLALPAIALFYLAATIASAVRHHRGRGGAWKNRVYPAPPTA